MDVSVKKFMPEARFKVTYPEKEKKKGLCSPTSILSSTWMRSFFGKTGVTIEKQGFIRFLLTAKPF